MAGSPVARKKRNETQATHDPLAESPARKKKRTDTEELHNPRCRIDHRVMDTAAIARASISFAQLHSDADEQDPCKQAVTPSAPATREV